MPWIGAEWSASVAPAGTSLASTPGAGTFNVVPANNA